MRTTERPPLDKIPVLRAAIAQIVKGKQDAINLAIVTLLAEGHLLIEDVPGVGKTTLGQALARALDCRFQRIQFTSDLLPSDVLGVSVYNPKLTEFEFKCGPIFANVILADEINRTTPKTQSALLEAMNENQVTIENLTYDLPQPFVVLATQNPVEHHGTYPLPESQLDRFLMRIEIGYPDASAEKEILKRYSNGNSQPGSRPVLTPDEVLLLQQESRKVHVEDAVTDYLIQIVNRTRAHPELELGISPRGTVALMRATQALAMIEGRSFVIPDDIKRLARPVFAHRLVLAPSAARMRTDPRVVLSDILDRTPVPV